MATCEIRGISVKFPFEPYDLQKNYMEKVIECILNRSNGILESPTGTGKTLSLLCASLAWLELKKAQLQIERRKSLLDGDAADGNDTKNSYLETLRQEIETKSGSTSAIAALNALIGMPRIIYASRTHSQLSQAMQELKRTSYKYMKATVLGSREQLCVHPDVRTQNHSLQIHMCRLKVKTRTCHFYNRVDKFRENPDVFNNTVLDIEDLVKTGETCKFCPYYMSKSLKNDADIVFMPYNYLLDPKARKALGIELAGNIIILDEAHNIDKMCEDSASIQIKSTDLTLCIEEITTAMKAFSEEIELNFNDLEIPRDFTADELCVLKEMFLDFEKELDRIELKTSPEGTTYDGDFIFEFLNRAGINDGNYNNVRNLIEKIVQFLSTASSSDGPFQRKGNGLQLISDLLTVAFASTSADFRSKIKKCYKVHITVEEPKKKSANNWLTKASKPGCKILSYWCFSPGFGMNLLMNQGVHCVILTSGTLAPLKPLISELELNVGVRLENPHIVKNEQICVRIVSQGPDMESLNCNFQNRDNPKYIQSLGRTILNLIRIIPDGILIFFPSYPIMQKYQQYWQETGVWGNINELKTIYVEPKDKTSFTTAMTDYYNKIKDPNSKGAIFMGVCRGKISEGVDFADINGRAVFIISLPYPPLKDPRVILKKRYLDTCNSNDKEYLRGDDWYTLEACRAVNQAMGRIIRHKDDYGAIVLLDSRFNNQRIKNQMSVWLRDQIKSVKNFGEIIRDLSGFFRNTPKTMLQIKQTPINVIDLTSDSSSSGLLTSDSDSDSLVAINRRPRQELLNPKKKMKITVIPNATSSTTPETPIKEFIVMVKKALEPDVFKQFLNTMASYRANMNFDELKQNLNIIFETRYNVRYIIPGLEPYIKEEHKTEFSTYCEFMK